MYCAKCGSQINLNLNYCNNCGAKTGRDDEESKVSPLTHLITALTFITLGGLGILVGLIALLLDRGVKHEAVAILACIYLVTLFGICFSLTRLTAKMVEAKIKEKTERPNQVFQPVQLPAPNTAQLEESYQPPASLTEQANQPLSVTEHTTRSFEQVYVKRN
jgi:hypothetical protein